MKSFSNFISETNSGTKGSGFIPVWDDDPNNKNKKNKKNKTNPSKKIKPLSNQSKELLKKTNKSTGGKVTVNTSEPWFRKPDPEADARISEIERDARGKKGQEIKRNVSNEYQKIDRKNNKINQNRQAFVDRVNEPPTHRKPDLQKGELGKLYKTNSAADPDRKFRVKTNDKINAELQAKRTARINPTTGKTTQKGVENFAINKLTKGLSLKGPVGKEQLANAKKLASNPSSPAYKELEKTINTSDYAGKRAKLASTKELDKIANDLKQSQTLHGKGPKTGPSNVVGQSTIKVVKPKTTSIKSINPNLNKVGGPVRSNYGKIKNTNSKLLTFKDFNKKATKSKLKLPKISAGNFASKAIGPAFAAWNFADNYKNTKGSAFRKFTKAALKTAAYYGGATGGATIGTGAGALTGPGAFVTGTIGAIAGGETLSNLTDKAFNKIWKPPTTTTKDKDKNNKLVTPPVDPKNKGYTWNTGITIGPSSRKRKTIEVKP